MTTSASPRNPQMQGAHMPSIVSQFHGEHLAAVDGLGFEVGTCFCSLKARKTSLRALKVSSGD